MGVAWGAGFSCASVLLPCESVCSLPATVPSPLLHKIYFHRHFLPLQREMLLWAPQKESTSASRSTVGQAGSCSLQLAGESHSIRCRANDQAIHWPCFFLTHQTLFMPSLLAQAAVFISLYILSKPFVRLLLSQGLRQSQHEIRPPWLSLWFSVCSAIRHESYGVKKSHHIVPKSESKLPMFLGVSQRWQIQKLLCACHFYCRIH